MVWHSGTNSCRNDLWSARALAPFAFAPLAFARALRGAYDARTRVYSGDGRATLLVEVPGRGANDIEIDVDGEQLTLKLAELAPESGGSTPYAEREIPRHATQRTYTLPWKIASEDVRATLRNGVLEIALTRAPEAEPRRITVTSN